MQLDSVTKVKTGIWLIIITVLISNVFRLREEVFVYRHYGYRHPATYYVSLHEKRMGPLRGILPGRGIVGYISDRKLEDSDSWKKFFLTQYALAPLVVLNEQAYPLVIGDFYKSVNVSDVARENNLKPVKELDNGLILFESERGQ